jgi:hypothetical protein
MPRVPTSSENRAHESYYVAVDRSRSRRVGLWNARDIVGDNGFAGPSVSLAERVALASHDGATDAN